MSRRAALRLFVALIAVVALVVATATPAAAVSASHPRHFAPTGPSSTSSGGAIIYHGGQVQTYPAIYVDFFGSDWNAGFWSCGNIYNVALCYTNRQAQHYILDFAQGLGGSSWESTLTQYCYGITVGSIYCNPSSVPVHNLTSQFKGWWVDQVQVPSSYGDDTIQASVERTVAHFNITDPNADIVVFSPHNKNAQGAFSGYWAYHLTAGDGFAYSYVPYLPDCTWCETNFVNKTNDLYGHGFFDGLSIAAGHEIAETITDPNIFSGWWTNGFGEVGDPCQPHGIPSRNVTLTNGQYFAMQPLWSNSAGGGCSFG